MVNSSRESGRGDCAAERGSRRQCRKASRSVTTASAVCIANVELNARAVAPVSAPLLCGKDGGKQLWWPRRLRHLEYSNMHVFELAVIDSRSVVRE